ncbi:hypothetical protein F2Q70_00035136 [Brassica cretica]|uniref:Uncharacterized protein n=1 Tax=Brassica cretica TaxID=69181 RepID=A0A8S9JTH7_BRACR|nr:hypothetical protein F2Q70_00035136 [Brassica cretica]
MRVTTLLENAISQSRFDHPRPLSSGGIFQNSRADMNGWPSQFPSEVVLPYFKLKLHGIYNKEREVRLWESLWGSEDQGFDEANFFTGEETIVSRRDNGNHELSV